VRRFLAVVLVGLLLGTPVVAQALQKKVERAPRVVREVSVTRTDNERDGELVRIA
jgi:hypothetical protein